MAISKILPLFPRLFPSPHWGKATPASTPAPGAAFPNSPVGRALCVKSLRYFLDNANPVTGFVRDRASNFKQTPATNRMASMAATGFGIAILANAAERHLIPGFVAEEKILKTLYAARALPQRNGWLYHFIDWETGQRFGKSEISTIDTALFMAGALYAAQVFPNSSLSRVANELYERLDFNDMMTNGGTQPSKRVLADGWTPEQGYLHSNWDSYSELMILVLLGLGHPTRPLPPECWTAWARPKLPLPNRKSIVGADLPLFTHQYSHLFVDFRNQTDGGGTNYFDNSALATEYNRDSCLNTANPTYQKGFWGLSACDSPVHGYWAYSPPSNQDGTVCLGAAAASIMFCPDLIARDVSGWLAGPYGGKIAGKYGFADSVNLGQSWVDPEILGITAGPVYLAIANLDPDHSVWSKFNQIPAIVRGMAQAGFKRTPAKTP